MKLKIFFLALLSSITLPFCTSRQPKSTFDCSRFQVGKLIRLVDSINKNASYPDYVHFFAKQLNIPEITAGENDSTLRIWIWQPGDTIFVLNIEKRGREGFAHLLGF